MRFVGRGEFYRPRRRSAGLARTGDLADHNRGSRETAPGTRDELQGGLHAPCTHQDGYNLHLFVGGQDDRKAFMGEKAKQSDCCRDRYTRCAWRAFAGNGSRRHLQGGCGRVLSATTWPQPAVRHVGTMTRSGRSQTDSEARAQLLGPPVKAKWANAISKRQ